MSGKHLALSVFALALGASTAEAGELACPLAEAGAVDVDGMLDDWAGVAHARAGGRDKDASFDVRCMVIADPAGRRLALALDVRDDYLSRRRKAGKGRRGEDTVRIALAAGDAALELRLWPGTEKVAPERRLGDKAAPKWLAIEDGALPRGWAVELVVPLARIGGWTAATPSLRATVAVGDADELEEVPAEVTSELALALGDQPEVFERFLRDTRLKKAQVKVDRMADVDPSTPGRERVVAGGKILGVIGESYSYLELPVASGKDVLGVELADLRGDGSALVLTHLRQHGGGGSRDVLIAWAGSGGRLEQVFAVEVRKEADGNRLESRWSLRAATRKAKGKKKPARGQELVVEAGPAVGWDEDTFEEVSADDAEPIHRPWDEARRGAVYWVDGGTLRSSPLKPEGKGKGRGKGKARG